VRLHHEDLDSRWLAASATIAERAFGGEVDSRLQTTAAVRGVVLEER
jgi:hypothetical protein